MSRFIIKFFTSALNICRLVPMLPVVIVAAIPLALLGQYRPWNAGLSSSNGTLVHIPVLGDPSVGQWLIIVLVLIVVVDTIRGMIEDIRHGQVGVDLLAVVAILSTVGVGEYWASWAVMLMIASGEAIEEYAQAKAESSLTALMSAAPQVAHISTLPGVGGRRNERGNADIRDNNERGARSAKQFDTVPVDDVRPDDVLIILPGETVPVDGKLLSGSAMLDLSNINGEPLPREVFAGARVMSGAVNGATTLIMRATKAAQHSQYQRILGLVTSAQESRPAVVKTADRLAVPFTILSLLIAGIAWAISGIPTRFAQVLVLATPCPLLIAAPVAYIAGAGRLAKVSVLIKAQDVLENLGRVTHVFFDKTGTLTVKQPQVVRVEMLPGAETRLDADHVLMMAGVIESYSVHVLARGIAAAGETAMSRLQKRFVSGQRSCPDAQAMESCSNVSPTSHVMHTELHDHAEQSIAPAEMGDVFVGTGVVPAGAGVAPVKPNNVPAKPNIAPVESRALKPTGWPAFDRTYPVVKAVCEEAGKGVSGSVNGHMVRVGRLSFVNAGVDGFQPVDRSGLVNVVGDVASNVTGRTSASDSVNTCGSANASDSASVRDVTDNAGLVDADSPANTSVVSAVGLANPTNSTSSARLAGCTSSSDTASSPDFAGATDCANSPSSASSSDSAGLTSTPTQSLAGSRAAETVLRPDAAIRTRFGMLKPDEMASYVSVDGVLIARIVLRDVPRKNARETLTHLRELGVRKLSMLTGDKRASAEIIAREVGIDDVRAELFPEDKVAAVRDARDACDARDARDARNTRDDARSAHNAQDAHSARKTYDSNVSFDRRSHKHFTAGNRRAVTMMVGDGVNDAPVLAVADIGVAMTDGTSTAASESAQVVIMNDDIASVPRAIAIARRTKRVMLQAVLMGLSLALIGMIAAACNLIPVVIGAFLQETIDIVSILWALTVLIDRE